MIQLEYAFSITIILKDEGLPLQIALTINNDTCSINIETCLLF